MTTRFAFALSSLALAAVILPGCSRALAQTAGSTQVVREEGSRAGAELVVYSGDFGTVRETRKVELKAGRTRLEIAGVSRRLDANSVLFDLKGAGDASVVSNTYDLGVGGGERLLERLVGREIELVYRGEDGKVGERQRGVLESATSGNVIVRVRTEEGTRTVVNPSATIEIPSDAGFALRPGLSAEVDSKSGGAADLDVSYMTGGLSWSADYVATLDPKSDRLSLELWAGVTNGTGTDFPDANLRFVAGSPNRVLKEAQEQSRNRGMVAGEMDAARAPMRTQAEMRPEAMGELVAYPYKSVASIRQDQVNRVRMMDSESVTVKRVYSIALPSLYRDYSEFGGNPDRRFSATLGINFVNAEGSGLGLPLPAGAVRVYEPGEGGVKRYVGAASIGDTPKDARVSLELSEVFNVYARARQTGARKIDKRRTARSVEVRLSNEKAGPVEVRVVQGFGGTWKVQSETHKGGKLNSSQNEWRVTVPAGGETKLRYTVVLGY